jgi:RNA polymerase sigma-70 factor (ECF subfamily)
MKPAGKPSTVQGLHLTVTVAQRYMERVKSYLSRRLRRSPQDVDDLAQEVYVRLLRVPEETLLRAPPAYLFRVAANVLNDFCRNRHKEGHVLFDSDTAEEIGESVPAHDPIAALHLGDELERAVASLPPRLAATILLRERDGYSYEEIALQLRVTVHTVHKHLAEARARLRMVLLSQRGQE